MPFREGDLGNGYPEEGNAPYGQAKKMLMVEAQVCYQQYDFNAIYLVPVDSRRPGANINPACSHVVPALTRKCIEPREAGEESVRGDVSPGREFLYVDDAAEGTGLATKRYEDQAPVSLGGGFEITIGELVERTSWLTAFPSTVKFDASLPKGQPRRSVTVGRAERAFGFRAYTDVCAGFQETIDEFEPSRRTDAATDAPVSVRR